MIADFLIFLYGISVIVILAGYHVKDRHLFLCLNALSVLLYCPYLVYSQAYIAVFILTIVAITSLMQAYSPTRQDKASFLWRLSLASVAIIIGLPFLVEQYSDVLPVAAYVFGRLSEIFPRKEMIVLMHLPTSSSWAAYYFSEDLMIYATGAILCFCSALYASRYDIRAMVAQLKKA